MSRNTVLHIPHSSKVIPGDLLGSFLLGPGELADEILAMTDHLTDRLFVVPGAGRVEFPVSRLVVDPERFSDDSLEPMAVRGMGVIYELTSTGERLRPTPSPAERHDLLRRFFHPHHRALTAEVAERLESARTCLVLDCHSFPTLARPFELDPGAPRPDINLGTDPFHTPPDLIERARKAFEEQGFWVEVDRPYRGALIPATFYRTDSRVSGLMVEVVRRLYMDETTGRALPEFDTVSARIQAALEAFA